MAQGPGAWIKCSGKRSKKSLTKMREKKDWTIFFCSLFFVLGFSFIFSTLGIFVERILSSSSEQFLTWLQRIGGIFIMLFGVYLLDIIHIPFLEREHTFKIKKIKSSYLTSFLLGAAFAVGWTPCVGAVLGAIFTLAVTQPSIAFPLMVSYSLGLGVPFLILGFWTNKVQQKILTIGHWFLYVRKLLGLILIGMGALVYVNQLGKIATVAFTSSLITSLIPVFDLGTSLNIGIAFLAGLVSFFSPCILPVLPGFLTYLASITMNNLGETKNI